MVERYASWVIDDDVIWTLVSWPSLKGGLRSTRHRRSAAPIVAVASGFPGFAWACFSFPPGEDFPQPQSMVRLIPR